MTKIQISFLLGAGFSSPKGYPLGNELNEKIQNFRKLNMEISSDWRFFKRENSIQAYNSNDLPTKSLEFCIRLIEEYSKDKIFNYEEFYDFIVKRDYIAAYPELCNSLKNDAIIKEDIFSKLERIYNQMIGVLIKDRNGNNCYDNMPMSSGRMDGYDGFLKILGKWKDDRIIHIHTLNHDMLFESFNHTEYISGEICDGFDELGSDYYGSLYTDDSYTYTVRLERFTAEYQRNIRLYKLHGSLNYVRFRRTQRDHLGRDNDVFIKIKHGIGLDDLLFDPRNGNDYEQDFSAYHANFLSGKTTKIQKYDDPIFYKKLFDLFRENLRNSEVLIIIGYGCKDNGINTLIKDDFKGHKIFIVDPYYDKNDTVKNFAQQMKATLYDTQISNLKIEDFGILS